MDFDEIMNIVEDTQTIRTCILMICIWEERRQTGEGYEVGERDCGGCGRRKGGGSGRMRIKKWDIFFESPLISSSPSHPETWFVLLFCIMCRYDMDVKGMLLYSPVFALLGEYSDGVEGVGDGETIPHSSLARLGELVS